MMTRTVAPTDRDSSNAVDGNKRWFSLGFRNSCTEAKDPIGILTLAIERGLSCLGDSVTQVIFYNLEKRYLLRRKDLAKYPDRFVAALRDIFGSGAETIEKLIVQSIRDVTGLQVDIVSPAALTCCIKEAEKALRNKIEIRDYL